MWVILKSSGNSQVSSEIFSCIFVLSCSDYFVSVMKPSNNMSVWVSMLIYSGYLWCPVCVLVKTAPDILGGGGHRWNTKNQMSFNVLDIMEAQMEHQDPNELQCFRHNGVGAQWNTKSFNVLYPMCYNIYKLLLQSWSCPYLPLFDH